jgi:hypothetical protein
MPSKTHYIIPTHCAIILEAEYLLRIKFLFGLTISQASFGGRNSKLLVMPG